MESDLSHDIRPGFENPVSDAQSVFRTVLEGMSRPATLQFLNGVCDAPPPLHSATMAILLALLDYDTPLWVEPEICNDSVRSSLAFHCGCPIVEKPAMASFAVVEAADPFISRFSRGSDEFPEDSATILVQAPAIDTDTGTALSGPGIETMAHLFIQGLNPGFWQDWTANWNRFPSGVDVIFVSGDRFVCLPRSTCISLGEEVQE